MKYNIWNEAETEQLLELMKLHGRNFERIGQIMRRSAQSCEHRWRWATMTDEQRLRRNERERTRRAITRGTQARAEKNSHPVRQFTAPDEVFTDRAARINTPRTLTGEFFGDPPPGYSALDRKRQGVDA